MKEIMLVIVKVIVLLTIVVLTALVANWYTMTHLFISVDADAGQVVLNSFGQVWEYFI